MPWSSQKLAKAFLLELGLQSHLNQDRPEQGVWQHSEAENTIAKTASLAMEHALSLAWLYTRKTVQKMLFRSHCNFEAM